MDKRNEFMLYLYQTAKMGYTSSKEMINSLDKQENKITMTISNYKEEYKKMADIFKEMLINNTYEVKENNPIVNISSFFGIKLELNKDNSDEAIAKMMIEGMMKGILEIETKLNKYNSILDPPEKKEANNLINFQKKSVKELEKYL